MRLARAATLVSAAFVASRALGLLRELLIGQQFGTSPQYDAYLAAFRIPDLLFQLIAGGALGSAFIPIFAAYLTRGDESGAQRLSSAVINLMFAFLAGAALLMTIFAPWLIGHIVAPLFSPEQQALTADLMRLMLISTVIFGVSGIVMGILNAQHHFLMPALAPIIYNLAIIAGAVWLGPVIGVQGLALGVVVG